MWRPGMRQLCLALFSCALVLTCLGREAQAADKKGKKRSAATVGAKLSERALGELMGPFKFGMGKQDVLRELSRQINERYKEKIAGTTDVYVQDKLRRDRQAELDRIKKSYVEFKGKKTGWDVSIIDDQFGHNTDEAMMVYWENAADSGRDQRRFFFFHDGQLYKMFIALNSGQLRDEQRSFAYFQNLMEQRYGAGKVQADKGIIEWKSGTHRLLAVDKLAFYGSFCLIISDPGEDQELADIRSANKKVKPENKVIKSVMEGGDDKQTESPGLDDNRGAVEGVVGD
jgi:hypothetical protein